MATTIVPSSALGPIPGATGGATQGHLIHDAYSGRWWLPTWGGVLDSGTATGAGQSTAQLQDTNKSWPVNAFLGASCILTSGPGAGEVFEIGPNTSNMLPVQNNGSPVPPQPGLATAPVAGSTTYQIVETRNVRMYVSSGPDFSTATWALANGGTTPNIANNTGIDMTGGSNDSGKHGEFPTDGRLLAVGYAPLNGVGVVMLLTQQNLHWQHLSCRGRLGVGAPGAVVWESTGPSTWEDRFPGNECEPTFLQALAIANSSTGRWHSVQTQNTFPIVGYPSTVIDSGLPNMALAWGGTRVSFDTSLAFLPWQAALAALAGGIMLAIYCDGTYDGTFGAGKTHQDGLRYAESSSESLWPTTNVGAAVPGLSSASNHPNDWGMAARNNADVHVVRRKDATTVEHVRYPGKGGPWGSVVTLPSTGLTGHLQGSGLPLVTDGTSVWCFAIDTDGSNSVRYIRWAPAGGWDSSWSTLSTGTNESKNFLVATMRADHKQIGVVWTTPNSTGFSGPPAYQVDGAALLLPDPPPVGGVGLTDPALAPQLLPGSPYAYMLWRPAPVTSRTSSALSQALTAGLSFSGGIARATSKRVSGGLSFAGGQSRGISRGIAAGLSFAGGVARAISKGPFTAGLSFAGSQRRAIGKAVAGGVTFSGGLGRGIARNLAASLAFSGGLLTNLIRAGATPLFVAFRLAARAGKFIAQARR